jgi:hypothetical protein
LKQPLLLCGLRATAEHPPRPHQTCHWAARAGTGNGGERTPTCLRSATTIPIESANRRSTKHSLPERSQKRPHRPAWQSRTPVEVIVAQKSVPTAAEAIAGARRRVGDEPRACALSEGHPLVSRGTRVLVGLRGLPRMALGVRPQASGGAVLCAGHWFSDQLFPSIDLLSKVLEQYRGVWCVARLDPKLVMSAAYRAFQAGRLLRAGRVAPFMRSRCSVEPEADGMSGRGTWL